MSHPIRYHYCTRPWFDYRVYPPSQNGHWLLYGLCTCLLAYDMWPGVGWWEVGGEGSQRYSYLYHLPSQISKIPLTLPWQTLSSVFPACCALYGSRANHSDQNAIGTDLIGQSFSAKRITWITSQLSEAWSSASSRIFSRRARILRHVSLMRCHRGGGRISPLCKTSPTIPLFYPNTVYAAK